MSAKESIAILKAPLTFSVGVMYILIGLYSLTFNIADAKQKNHRQAEKAARIGGWFFIIVGTVLALLKFF